MPRRREALWICATTAIVILRAGAAPLLYERFEGMTIGTNRGVSFSADVIGYGGIGRANDSSALFGGQADTCVDHGRAKQITATDFTVEAVLKLSPGWAYAAIAADWSETDSNRSWALVVTPDRALRFDISPDGAFHPGNRLVTAPRLIRQDTWYHVAAVSQGETSRIYVNGREVAHLIRAVPGIFTGDQAHLKIGNVDGYADNQPKPWRGNLDEVRISPGALAPAEFIQTREGLPEAACWAPGVYELPFAATTKEEALAWQSRARGRLSALVAAQEPRRSTEQAPLDLQVGQSVDRGDYTLYHATFQGNQPGQRHGVRLCVPKGEGPFPAMLCLHGHGGAAEAVFDPQDCYHGFADRFARGGYVVLAPSFPHRPYAAMMLWDLFRCVDILAAHPKVDPGRLGVGGLSMGGEWSMWIAACDERLKVAVISGWMCTTEGVFSVPNCSCWELPGFVELMDICEVNLLIAPRKVVFESAERDGCFPVGFTRQGFARIAAGYKIFGAEHAASHDVFPGVHEWHGKIAFPLVDSLLGGRAGER